ncbi:MAG: RNA polymerase sigma factor [Oscillospiraceae bacterium]|jgi:RNA polymerase sigma-70 factor (ECF subfamily)|nr:RNA polymerase sigma factor [Oscillospiraceae bacterium]
MVRQERGRSAEEAYEAFCAGDESGFDQLMREFQQSLVCFLLGYVHSPEAAEDLAEDTFVELLLHKGRFRGQSSFKTFLFSVARHKAIDHLRREKRRPAVPLDDVTERGDDAMGPEELVLAGEQGAEIARAIRAIPQEYQEVLRLLYLERLSYEEIAPLMRKSRKQIDNLAYRARQALKISLGREAIWIEKQ